MIIFKVYAQQEVNLCLGSLNIIIYINAMAMNFFPEFFFRDFSRRKIKVEEFFFFFIKL